MSKLNSPTLGVPAEVRCFDIKELETLSLLVRKSVFEICLTAEHGHIGGSSAAVELFVSLYFGGVLRMNIEDYNDPLRDRVLVRGHLGPVRYKLFALLGWIEECELDTYRRIGSRLHGHEDHTATPGVDISPSGSLGMLLSYGVGAALSARDQKLGYRTFVFLGDGEEQEGMVSEAARHAAHLKLGNLITIIDRNGMQLSNPVVEVDSSDLAKIWEGYGWKVVRLHDGHSIPAILTAYKEALGQTDASGSPTVIIADTCKGAGLTGARDHFSGYHTISRCSNDVVRDGISKIESDLDQQVVSVVLEKIKSFRVPLFRARLQTPWSPIKLDIQLNERTPNHPDSCQNDYFISLRKLIEDGVVDKEPLYFLTADVTTKGTVDSLKLREIFHFHNVGIREQHMVSMAHGLSVVRQDARILINSFDAFTYRSLDQINAALQGNGNFVIIGDVSGLTNAQNGKTHQTTGLSSALLSMEGVTFLEPWDANDMFACLNWAIGESRRVVYLRVHSSTVRFAPDAGCKRTLTYYTVREATSIVPDCVLVCSGLTVDSCVEASELLGRDGLSVRVVNVINPNALDDGFVKLVENNRAVFTVYNGHPKVLRQAVADALMQDNSVRPTCIHGIGFTLGNTGRLDELLSWAKIDGRGVYSTVKRLLGR